MRKLFLALISLNILFGINNLFAQDTLFNGWKHKLGFITGNGIQFLGQLAGNDNHSIALKVNYEYRVTFYQLQYYISVSRKKAFGIDLVAQPQYNSTTYKPLLGSAQYVNGYEVGLNLGLLARENVFHDLLSFYFMIGTGPHYTSGTVQRQANGFIFSDNFAGGVNIKLTKNLYADWRSGLRHISNAGLRIPNGGINTLTMREGFLLAF